MLRRRAPAEVIVCAPRPPGSGSIGGSSQKAIEQ
jgi:hypothetical protein